MIIKWPDNRRENRGINLVCYGDPEGYSAMAKTVGFPCAIATRYIIDLEMYTLIEHFLEGIALLRLWYLLQVYL